MKLGIISYGFEKKHLQKVKDLGLDFVEFCVNADAANRFQEFYDKADEINANCKELGIFVGSVGRWAGNKINKDGSHNEAEWLADTTLIKAAAKVGSPVYVCSCNYVDELSLYENYTAAISYFEKLIAFAKEYNIKVATCNCRWNNYVVSDPAWSVIHGHLKDLYIKYDPSHCVYAKGENYLSEIKKWGHRFAHVHIKGSLMIDGERFDDPPAGLDQTDWKAFIGALYATGYDGTLSIEPHSEIWQGDLGDRGVKYTIKMMRELML
jgi:sugar phosphate isomerase/epimerase